MYASPGLPEEWSMPFPARSRQRSGPDLIGSRIFDPEPFLIGGFVAVLISVGAIWWFIFWDTAPEAVSLIGGIGAAPADEEPCPRLVNRWTGSGHSGGLGPEHAERSSLPP